MGVEFLEHTADVRFRVTSSSIEGLFNESAEALMNVLKPKEIKGACEGERRVVLSSIDQTALLIDFLNEILSLSQLHGEVFRDFSVTKMTDKEVTVLMKTCAVTEFGEVVKAVTYHGADIKQNDKGVWEVEVILDV